MPKSKKFILNADDFGLTYANNQAVLEGYTNGFLTSASLCANGEAYENAVNDIIPDCPNLDIAVHLNIMEGKSLTNCPLLTDKNGDFNKSYLFYIINSNNKSVLSQIEAEFRAQIEKVRENIIPNHIDSHVHTHAIPSIFKITCKLADEFNIKYVRTQHEKLYIIPSLKKHFNFKYPINLIKIALLNYFTAINKNLIKEYGLKSNDYILGVGYTGMMDSKAIEYGLKSISESGLTEALIHPKKYTELQKDSHVTEFEITQDLKLKDTILRLGFEISNYVNI